MSLPVAQRAVAALGVSAVGLECEPCLLSAGLRCLRRPSRKALPPPRALHVSAPAPRGDRAYPAARMSWASCPAVAGSACSESVCTACFSSSNKCVCLSLAHLLDLLSSATQGKQSEMEEWGSALPRGGAGLTRCWPDVVPAAASWEDMLSSLPGPLTLGFWFQEK